MSCTSASNTIDEPPHSSGYRAFKSSNEHTVLRYMRILACLIKRNCLYGQSFNGEGVSLRFGPFASLLHFCGKVASPSGDDVDYERNASHYM